MAGWLNKQACDSVDHNQVIWVNHKWLWVRLVEMKVGRGWAQVFFRLSTKMQSKSQECFSIIHHYLIFSVTGINYDVREAAFCQHLFFPVGFCCFGEDGVN